jgi:hypothetical protein
VRTIVSNSKYIGRWVWGRTTTVRNSKGQTKQEATPKDKWVSVEREDLRIIAQATWEAAQRRLKELGDLYGKKAGQKKRRPRVHHSVAYPTGLLPGLLFL